ncbi:hypothetical protein SAICODRAFT_18980 [Saitoella complicata NRRL Y-17804]|uniref:Uncharacterized protein n=1 Tax=Saitoella complicata (strain BCRC 22490 / CBS 7301 / JCM 7358 / NBRC 10748 / NRRL Y-17804) TaxID=698492 RepID=A0A0E9NMZ3_SAICN|nr:uncharacterized protein SAICODRAFT_18980 [Saitoella complicata NRRL Y-17804]ODQ53503.1 hypothetical protein SAICODRAFT_18980 [Saitoella complicata NRRL Y-17804]GAO51051.1 hypothetical protein G7K_5163-t1 [Saitoella complicata NRRL Y-17804]
MELSTSARIQELTKKLRTTLSYAHWKASHNHQTSTISELEERYLGGRVHTHRLPMGTLSHASASTFHPDDDSRHVQQKMLLPVLSFTTKQPDQDEGRKDLETVWDHPELNPASSRPSSIYNGLTSHPTTPTRTRFDSNPSSKHHHSRTSRSHRRVPSLQTQLQLQQSPLVFPPFFTASPERKRNPNPMHPRHEALALHFGLDSSRPLVNGCQGSSPGLRPGSEDSAAAQIMMMFLNSGAHSPGDTELDFGGEEEEEEKHTSSQFTETYSGRKRTAGRVMSGDDREETVEPQNVKRRR